MPSHFIIELNARIDVLILAFFASDVMVGIYSFVALITEGIFQIGTVVRTVITPRLTIALASKKSEVLNSLINKAGRLSLWSTIFTSIIIVAAFSSTITLLEMDQAMLSGRLSLMILLIGVSLTSFYSPFWMSFALAGRPGIHMRMMCMLLLINSIFAVTLVPMFGMEGAAFATAMMFMSFPFLLRIHMKKYLGFVI